MPIVFPTFILYQVFNIIFNIKLNCPKTPTSNGSRRRVVYIVKDTKVIPLFQAYVTASKLMWLSRLSQNNKIGSSMKLSVYFWMSYTEINKSVFIQPLLFAAPMLPSDTLSKKWSLQCTRGNTNSSGTVFPLVKVIAPHLTRSPVYNEMIWSSCFCDLRVS